MFHEAESQRIFHSIHFRTCSGRYRWSWHNPQGLCSIRLKSRPNHLRGANSCSAIVANAALYGSPNSQDWYNLEHAFIACRNEWLANGRDAGVMAAMSSVSPYSITSDNLDQNGILQYLQIFNPAFDLGDVQTLLAYIDTSQDQIPTVLSNMQSYGLSGYMSLMAKSAEFMGMYLDQYYASSGSGSKSRLMRVGAFPPQNGCSSSGLAIVAAGLAFGVIGVMTLGTAPVLVGAAWAGIALWGGNSMIAAGVGHAIVCGS
jgi:hypothetical protein